MSDLEEDAVLENNSEEDEDKENDPEDEVKAEEQQILPCSLTQDMIAQNLSLLCRTGNGLAHAFVKLDLKAKKLTDIDLLSSFVHLRYLDISSNYLTDLSPLAALKDLLWLKGDFNHIQGFQEQPLGQLVYLQWFSLVSNRITDMEGLVGPELENLNLAGNSIQSISGLECGRLTNLISLDLRGNSLENITGINLPSLRYLYLAQNKIKDLEGLDKLEFLTTLHLRDNQLETLNGISSSMTSLSYLNVRGNMISSEQALQDLVNVADTLRTLVLTENPLSEKEDYRLSVLTLLPRLERIDKDRVSADEVAEAQERVKEDSPQEEEEDI